MASKKQRRRRAKEQRHDYVWVDDEGNELDPEDVPDDKTAAGPVRQARGQRRAQAPSWARTLKRAAIFAPIMFGTVVLLSPHLSMTTKITQTVLIVAIFVPFSYLVDRFLYRSFLRREARAQQPAGRRGS